MPRCALPDRLKDPAAWTGTDDDTALMRWRIRVNGWFAFSHRCAKGITGAVVFLPGLYLLPATIWFTGWSWWYLFPVAVIPVARQWREFPVVIAAFFGGGFSRWETGDGQGESASNGGWMIWQQKSALISGQRVYLSRVQYWSRWHVALCWPLLLTVHWYWRASDVLPVLTRGSTDGRVRNFYRGWYKDGDGVFWGDAAGGPNFK